MSKSSRKTKSAKARILKPTKLSAKRGAWVQRERGPLAWGLSDHEETYQVLESTPAPGAPAPAAGRSDRTAARPGAMPGDRAPRQLLRPAPTVWVDRLKEFRGRKQAALRASRPAATMAMATAPGARNWLPLGPSVVLDGQTVGSQPVGGRVPGIAVAPGGQVVYAATACGGVFRSDDGGASWRSLMDGFDTDPTNFASASLSCGAIAIDAADPNRVYVGTGEGDTQELFNSRIVAALPAYRGIGPIRSDDGGATWISEPTAGGAPPLEGQAFLALAVDPNNRENVVAATTAGLYQRTMGAGGKPVWVQRRPGLHSSVVAAGVGPSARFFAAEWGGQVFDSPDGTAWTARPSGFPTSDVGRVALGVQRASAAIVYALVAKQSSGGLLGVFRFAAAAGQWKAVTNPPDVLPLYQGQSQGSYDLAIAVDPARADRIYLGGSYANVSPYPGSVWRVDVAAAGGKFKCTKARSIGTHAHSDVHVLVHTPDDATELWCGCDGGVFLNRDPGGTGEFSGQNAGLSCLCSNFIAQHPTDPGILFTGLQDNGTARTSGEPSWKHVNGGDGGYCLINWAQPSRVLSFENGTVYRATDGGVSHGSWAPVWNFSWATMTQPIVSAPYNPGQPGDANTVAVGAGESIYVSDDFASTWLQNGLIQLPQGSGAAFALAFASRNRLFVGTTAGRVFRADRTAGSWTLTRLDNVGGGSLGVVGLVCDVAVDWSDAALKSVYVAFGGLGDRRRVWRFDGAAWQVRSGPAGGNGLLDVEHNAIAIDRAQPGTLYVGADIGVWGSTDGGLTWAPLENGLPDAPVFDLQIHPTQRLLRAATYGRGIYELPLP